MSGEQTVRVELAQREDYRFDIAFGGTVPPLMGDEPPPLGTGQGPSPVQLLTASVGNCLCDSLLFALRKFGQAPEPISCTVDAEVGRNAQGRLRVLEMRAVLRLGVAAGELKHIERAVSQFDAFCTVTQSVGQSIPITIEVLDASGERLK
ncbi:MAG: OsmC family protein [Burkholderiales bacterium]